MVSVWLGGPKVETTGPDAHLPLCTTRRGSEHELPTFLEDVGSEQPQSMRHTLLRTRRGEPLTIAAEG